VLIIGDGPERLRLEGLARELGVSDRIDFLGAAPHEAMPGLLASGEIAIFPSLMEATSVAALEAMACERPVLATDVGGLPEIVDERVGGLVPPRDPGGLARGVVRLLRDPHLVEKGQIARERVVTHWSNARLVDRHLEIYRTSSRGGRFGVHPSCRREEQDEERSSQAVVEGGRFPQSWKWAFGRKGPCGGGRGHPRIAEPDSQVDASGAVCTPDRRPLS
jgi:hypothetical protein